MTPDDIYKRITGENERRLRRLRAEYDPVTGEGLAELLGERRVRLDIPDFAIPTQWVPEAMMRNPLIKAVVKAGSIERYIASKKWVYGVPDKLEIERRIRRIRHKHDFCHWAYFCVWIKHKRLKKRVRFMLNLPQLIVLAKCEELRGAGVPIALIILKARQWGGSTFCFFYQVWLQFKWNEFHSFAIAAHTSSASETILNMLKRSIKDYPAWDLGLEDGTELRLAPADTSGHAFTVKDQDNRQVLEGFIYVGTAEKPDTLRSKDISGAHYSEVGVWPDTPGKQAEDIIADIQGGLLEDTETMEVMESTAKSSDDYFHMVWESCSGGEGGYVPVFISFIQIENDTREIKDKRAFVDWLWEHREDERTDGKWKDSGKYYWWLWELGATLEHINWYRYRRLKLSFAKMCNEAPATPEQAFITAGQKVFDPFEVARKRERCREPVMTGDLISDAHEGKEILDNIRFVPNSSGALRIWEEPDDSPISNRYVVAVDIGGPNETSDWSSVRVLDRLMMMPDFGLAGKPNVVAEMRYHTDHDKLAYDAVRLSEWYGHALLVIESNTLETRRKDHNADEEGFEYILDIISDIYDNLYMRQTREEDVREGVVGKWGFHTNALTKPKIIDNMRTCLRDDLWDEPSTFCLDEMSMYIDEKGQYNAPPGKHDDVLMATAILLWVGFKEMPIPAWVKPRERGGETVRGDRMGLTNI
ncbi:MAG: terminase [Bacteroidales bacterium]|nr:terminase [Bacteroidales bacterium]